MSANKQPANGEGAEQPAVKRVKPDYSDTITVVVGRGANKKRFTVHKAPLCAKSPFFKAACDTHRWAEGKNGVVEIAEYNPQSFEFFMHWVYSDKIEVELVEVCEDERFVDLARAWSLADYLGANTLCNLVVDCCEVRAHERKYPNVKAFQHIRRGSGIWRLYVDLTADKV